MHNKKLAIAIPTYNRHEILYEDLALILPELIQHSIAVYISDDSNNDNTQEIVNELTKQHPYIYYVKNNPSLGHDKNILRTLQLPDTDYVWLLGDSGIIKNGSIQKLLKILTTDYDFIFINSNVKNTGKIGKIDDIKEFLITNSWYLTLTGATIYNSNVVRFLYAKQDVKYYNNFQQLAIIFTYVSSLKTNAYWVNECYFLNNTKKISYWYSKVFDVFVNDWTELIRSFPLVFTNDKKMNEVIFSHASKTNLFGFVNLLMFRSLGGLNIGIIISNYKAIRIALKKYMITALVVSIIPKWFATYIIKIKRLILSHLNTNHK